MKRERIQHPRRRPRVDEPALEPRPALPDRRDLKARIERVKRAIDDAIEVSQD